MKILFTGGSSFTGYWFIRALVESVQERVELVEQRQSFFESLLESRAERVRLEEGVGR